MPWIATIPTTAIDSEGLASAQAGKVWVALYQVEDEYFASAVLCTHGQASLADGYLEDFLIECPLHQGAFDIRTGEAVGAPCTIPVRVFPVRVEDGIIHVEVKDDEV
jgi:naphthalene 1,2-dioxygenase system ferredoxin subunit